jgi:hypothetical protein
VIPYSAVQLFEYETYNKLLMGDREEISVVGWLTAGACAGMTSTLVSYIFVHNLENLQQCVI